MAIISIPTSIGGVSIPGALVNGPLGALFGNGYNMDMLQYPRDLNSATRGHMVQFTVNETQPITYDSVDNPIADAADTLGLVSSVIKNLNSSKNLSLNPRTKKGVATISLYIPDTVNFTYNSGYTGQTLMETAAEAGGAAMDLLGKFGKVGKLAGSAATSKTLV
jgi:hypothetical protein